MFTLCYIIKNKLIVFLRNSVNYYTIKLFKLQIIIIFFLIQFGTHRRRI